MDGPGTYTLIISVLEPLCLKIGRLGAYEFPPGYYIYAGSALRGMDSRLKRHLRSDKRLHWHIDYLLLRAKIIQIWYTSGNAKLECVWNSIVAGLPGAIPLVPGFGSSDCRCRTHLTRFVNAPPLNSFRRELKKHGLPRLRRLII